MHFSDIKGILQCPIYWYIIIFLIFLLYLYLHTPCWVYGLNSFFNLFHCNNRQLSCHASFQSARCNSSAKFHFLTADYFAYSDLCRYLFLKDNSIFFHLLDLGKNAFNLNNFSFLSSKNVQLCNIKWFGVISVVCLFTTK